MGAQTKPDRTSQRELDAVVLRLLPRQGAWSEEQYLWLTDHTNHLIEFTDGYVEVLPMPTDKHQAISLFLLLALLAYVQRVGGRVFYAPLRLRIRPGKHREPDLLLLLDANDPRRQNRYWLGADLVEKRHDYAEAGIPEYWIVNPLDETIAVLRLDGDRHVEHGVFGRGARATSALLAGFAVDVDALFDAH